MEVCRRCGGLEEQCSGSQRARSALSLLIADPGVAQPCLPSAAVVIKRLFGWKASLCERNALGPAWR